MSDVFIDILGTKLDIGPSQTRPLVAVADIFHNGHQRLVKLGAYSIGPTWNNGHNLDPSKP